MMNVAVHMKRERYILRSGGAMGADTAFFAGATPACQIWLPSWKQGRLKTTIEAHEMAEQFHPVWDRLGQAVKQLHARNSHIIMGADLKTPVDVVICWTEDGKATGGTGQGLRIADHFGIPVHNLFFPDIREHYERLRPWQQLKSAST